MAEKEDKYSFMEEEIVNTKKSRTIIPYNRQKVIFMITSVLFGLIGGILFTVSAAFLNEWIQGPGEGQVLSFVDKATATPKVSVSPTISPKPEKNRKELTLLDYEKMYRLAGEQARNCNRFMVGVSNVLKDKDLFQTMMEGGKSSSGVIIANNGKNLLILTSYEEIKAEKKVAVCFFDGTVMTGRIYSSDSELNLGIISIPVSKIPKATMNSIDIAEFGDAGLEIGTACMAVGSPNGKLYSGMLGYITNSGKKISMTDCQVESYDTDFAYYENGNGVICSMNGDVIGILNQNTEDSKTSKIVTFWEITKLKPIIENMVNQRIQKYVGIKASDVTAEYAQKLNRQTGIYIEEIENDSPAYNAGLQVGDVITGIDKHTISTVSGYYNVINQYEVEDTITITAIRGTLENQKEKKFELELERRK